jgi:LL-diaminopimelate aminotransferase
VQLSPVLTATGTYPFVRLEEAKRRLTAAGVELIDFGKGDPREETDPLIRRALAESLEPVSSYPLAEGLPELREAVSAWCGRRFGVELDPDREVIPTYGSKEAIFHLAFVVLDRDSERRLVLSTEPGYPVYDRGALFAGAGVEQLPLREENGFLPDLDSVTEEQAARANVLFLNYPNNPTGAVVAPGFFERAVEFGREHDLVVVHDNAYSEITFDGYVAPSFLQTPGAKEVGIEIFSPSKGWNMTGWRSGLVAGNAEIVERYRQLKTNLDSGMFEAVQRATVAALTEAADFPRQMSEIYRRRRDLVAEGLAAIGLDVEPPKATPYFWVRVPEGYTSEAFAELVLEEAAVIVSPGPAYGPSGEGFFRISLTVPDDRLSEAVRRIETSLQAGILNA